MELTELKHKSLQFEFSGVDEEQGIFEGYASVFGVLEANGRCAQRPFASGGQDLGIARR